MDLNNTSDLRNFLIDQMKATAAGKLGVGEARMVCNFAQQIYNTVKIEITFAMMREKSGNNIKVEPITWKPSPSKLTKN